MVISRLQKSTRINTIVDTEVLDRVERKTASNRYKEEVLTPTSFATPYLKGEQKIENPQIFQGNIENFYGLAQTPVGLIGPLKVNGPYSNGRYYVPLATTEGALVASYNRGAKVITKAGGVNVLCIKECMTRSPGFVFNDVLESTKFVAWANENFSTFKTIAKTTTRHGQLEDMDSLIDGRYVWLNFKFSSKDAAGQNMVTIATDAIGRYVKKFCPIQPHKWYIDANISGDKKPTRLAQLTGRGKYMLADITIKRELVKQILHTTPEEMVEYSRMATLGSMHSGAIGSNGHFANALTAIFLACGQDVACVVESSTGTSKAELTQDGDLYVNVALPNLVVGTVGGGTHLPTQQECLSIMDCAGPGKAAKFAEICTAVVMAGEISIASAIVAGHFTLAHKKLGRKKANHNEKERHHVNQVR